MASVLVLLPRNPNQGKSKRNLILRHSYLDHWFSSGAVPPLRMCPGNFGCIFGYHNDKRHANWYLVAGGQMCGTLP